MKMKAIYNKIVKFFYPYAGTVYSRIGGKKTIDPIVDRFYGVMSTDPLARECLETHKKGFGRKSRSSLKNISTAGWVVLKFLSKSTDIQE